MPNHRLDERPLSGSLAGSLNDRVWGAKWSLKKLRLDFTGGIGTCRAMADNPRSEFAELIAHLCLEAGRIMEDVSTTMAMRLPETTDGIDARITRVRQAGEDIATLAMAAEVLARRALAGT